MLTKNVRSIYFNRFSLQLENVHVEKKYIEINLIFLDVDGSHRSGAVRGTFGRKAGERMVAIARYPGLSLKLSRTEQSESSYRGILLRS